MKAELKAQYLSEYITAIKYLQDEAVIRATPDGFHSLAVDRAHVAMAEVKLPKTAFEKYEVNQTGEELGWDLENIVNKHLKFIKPEQTVRMETIQEKRKNTVAPYDYTVFNTGNLSYKRQLLLTAGLIQPKIPRLNTPAWALVSIEELRLACRAADAVSDHIVFKISPEGLVITAQGETDDVEYKPQLASSELNCKEGSFKSMFPLDYFSQIINSIPTSQTKAKIHLSTDYPIKIEYALSPENSYVMHLLAPRVETV